MHSVDRRYLRRAHDRDSQRDEYRYTMRPDKL